MSTFLERYAYPSLDISYKSNIKTGLIIVIPVFNETKLLDALNSLADSDLPEEHIEVLIIINQSEQCDLALIEQNRITYEETKQWIGEHTKAGLTFYVKHLALVKKHAGVGLARKVGMDEAARRFEAIGNHNGIILCFDADCICATNYINEVYRCFTQNHLKGASIHYEHKFNKLPHIEKEGILQYELHLRYYINGMRKAGYPYAFHTVGSSMAVRTDIYKKAGGMNKRKAGEDFHFLHKVIPYQNFEEITSTTVFPSPRISNRVAFGTGKAMDEWVKQEKTFLESYHPDIFTEMEGFLKQVPHYFNSSNKETSNLVSSLSPEIQSYLLKENYLIILADIKRQSNSTATFLHRWFGWFNGLRALHLVHHLRDNKYTSIPVIEAASRLISSNKTSAYELLNDYRRIDKNFKANQISLKHLYSEHL